MYAQDKPMLSAGLLSRVRMIQMPLFGFQVIRRCVRRCVPSFLQTLFLSPLSARDLFYSSRQAQDAFSSMMPDAFSR